MRIDVVCTVLCIVFEDKDRSVLPIRTMRNRVHHSSKSEIVIGYSCGGRGNPRLSGRRVIVGQAQQDELWHRVVSGSALRDELLELVKELVSAKLIGKIQIEIRIPRIEVID